ncbi:MAG: autotransporter outer membrane beta-barrel domain-containing protein [Puniceicoccales bacterium]|jgi:hypothetical protein|nr:autotransporter outer membrane beta-barrel domain-containing protein [Puniceicoccales bacterium]
MNIREKRIFTILMVIIGCLIASSSFGARWPRRSSAIIGAAASFGDPLREDPVVITVAANNLLTNALSSRMTNIKNRSAELFVHAIYGHNTIVGGYKNNMGGLVLGFDNVWAFANEKYFHLGTAFGYVHGKTTPSSEAFTEIQNDFRVFCIDPRQFDINFGHDAYAIRMFGAYESFNDKCLKTNIGVILGYNHSKDRYQVGNLNIPELKTVGGRLASHSAFLEVEFIKNLYACKGYQFGLWLKANYIHIFQHTFMVYGFHGGSRRSMLIDKTNHDFLATVVGLNIEKEFKHVNRTLVLFLKTGWECRVIQRTFITIIPTSANSKGEFPIRNAAIISFGASQKLGEHWGIGGSYSAELSKDFLAHSLSGGIEYAF